MLNLRYPGQYYDAETGTNYNLNRNYESATGQYSQADPTGFCGGISLYRYAGGNPLNAIDPSGLAATSPAPAPAPPSGPTAPAPSTGPVPDYGLPANDPVVEPEAPGAGGAIELCASNPILCGIGAVIFPAAAGGPQDETKPGRDSPNSLPSPDDHQTPNTCPKNGGDDNCYGRFNREVSQCERWIGRGPADDPNRWYRACLDRAAYRRTLCLKGIEDGPPAWSDNDLK